jgi:hypothetical protein
MSEFQTELRRRYSRAQAALRTAQETGDEYGADVHSGEIDSLRRLADEHDVTLDDQSSDQQR